ncbi:MAG: hypothetical protein V4577_31925, partial [Bacteroidota bacterium]
MASSRISSAVYFTLQTDTTKKSDTTKNNKPPKGKKTKPIPAGKTVPAKNDTTKESLGDVKSEVKTHAEDSTITDNVHNIVYLYGQARVTYEDFELDADYIRVDKNNNLLFAKGSIDPLTKRYVGRPISKQKNDKPVESDSLLFNYKTKKGRVFN